MSKEISQELLEKYFRKECTAEEAKQVILWLKDENNSEAVESIMQSQWKKEPNTINTDEKLKEIQSNILNEITHDIKVTPKNLYINRLKKIAIPLCLLIFFQILFFYFQSDQSPEISDTFQIIKSTSSGEKLTSRLPDGTIVTLNAESKLTYPKDLQGETRSIQLTGEAFFEVAKDKDRPFIVQSGPIAIRAVGTTFNVNANPNTDIVVSLTEGIVLVNSNIENKTPQNDHYLEPGEEITYSKKGTYLKQSKFNYKAAVGWKEGILVFDGDGINEIKAKIEKWYGVQLILKNQRAISSWQFTGEYKNESLENVLKGLKYSKNINYIIHDDSVEITFL